jgi:cytochrome oxidase Cu insertion factor (SCO1/SenC/PrrC family)
LDLALGEEKNDDYLVDHSIIMYFMDQEGRFLEFYGTSLPHEEIEKRIKIHVSGKSTWDFIMEWFDDLWRKV